MHCTEKDTKTIIKGLLCAICCVSLYWTYARLTFSSRMQIIMDCFVDLVAVVASTGSASRTWRSDNVGSTAHDILFYVLAIK